MDSNVEIQDRTKIIQRITIEAQPFQDIEHANLDDLISRCQDARVILLGESSHGTSEFYAMRARITEELVKRCGFSIIGIEADWPDVEITNCYIRHLPVKEKTVFDRFPTWMWNNQEFMAFVERLRQHNAFVFNPKKQVNLYGLDLYCLDRSIDHVVEVLESRHPRLAAAARHYYSGLSSWGSRSTEYGLAVLQNSCPSYEKDVRNILQLTIDASSEFIGTEEEYFHLIRNMVLIVHAENCFRRLPESRSVHWNLRDRYMFETLEALLRFHGDSSKAIIWAHNNHIGNGSGTQMLELGVYNLGRLCKERFGNASYLIGFGFDHGTILAAPSWGAPVQSYTISPALNDSIEGLCHETEISSFFLPLGGRPTLRQMLLPERSTRAFGSVYSPEKESSYLLTHLPEQFDEWVWFDEGHAVKDC